MFEKIVLKNNILLLSHNAPEMKVCSTGFWFFTGSRFEDSSCYGISHFTEHMIFKGTARMSAQAISSAFDRMGGVINAFTEREDVCLYSTVPVFGSPENVMRSLEIMADMSHNSQFDGKEFEKEREVVENEILAVEDDSEEVVLDQAWKCVWPEQSLSYPIAATVEDVEKITVPMMKEWFDRYFAHGELVVSICGNFDLKQVTHFLETLPVHKTPLSYPSDCHFPAALWKSGLFLSDSTFNQTNVVSMFPLKNQLSEKEFYCLCIFNAFAGDSMASRLFDVLREKNGLCYTVYSFFSCYENVNCWCAFASASEGQCVRACELLKSELGRIFAEGVGGMTDEEFAGAREHVAGEILLSSTDAEYGMKRLFRSFQSGFECRPVEETVAMIRSITRDQLECVFNAIDSTGNAFVVQGPKVRKMFKKFKL